MIERIEDDRPKRPEYGAGAIAPWGWYFGEFASNNPSRKRWKIYNSQ